MCVCVSVDRVQFSAPQKKALLCERKEKGDDAAGVGKIVVKNNRKKNVCGYPNTHRQSINQRP